MQRTSNILAAAALLGIGALMTSGSALAGGARNGTGGLPDAENGWGFRYGPGASFNAQNTPAADQSYVFNYEHLFLAGHDVHAIAVELTRSGFRHRRVGGPGIVCYRGQHPRSYRIN